MKIIEILQQQATSEREKASFSIGDLAGRYLKTVRHKRNSTLLPPIINKPTKKVILMNDEYTIKDLHFDKIRSMHSSELQGPSLKQMEAYTRVQEANILWRTE